MRYYLDTCIWRDYVEERVGKKGRLLGINAQRLFLKIISQKATLYYSKTLLREIRLSPLHQDILEFMDFVSKVTTLVFLPELPSDLSYAKNRAKLLDIPLADVLHALLAGRHGAVLVTTDPDFDQLKDLSEIKKPEELLP